MARSDKTMAFDTPREETSAGMPDEMPEGESTAPEGETISLDAFGGKPPAVGDSVSFKVTSIDEQNGTATVTLAVGPKKIGGIAGKVAAMDEEDQASITA